MRILGFLFALYVLFLSVQPGLRDLGPFAKEKAESCCNFSCNPLEDESSNDDSKQNEEKETNACNPFQFCKCCVVFSSTMAFPGDLPEKEYSIFYIENKERVLPQISVDFWQPPKIG